MSCTWVAGAGILAVASFVFGLTGFGIGLVSLSLLPFFVPPATVVPLITLYGAAFALVMTIQLRRDVMFSQLVSLLIGTVLGTPVGVWVLGGVAAESTETLDRPDPHRDCGDRVGWAPIRRNCQDAIGASALEALAGLLGGAVGTPGPPVLLYAVAQGWSPRVMKAMLQAFFLVNQSVIVGTTGGPVC